MPLSSFLRAAVMLFVVAGTPVLVVALVRSFFGVPLEAFRPVLSDEIEYWHQTATFAAAGFHGGYYTLGELTNPSGFTPSGPHGPGFTLLQGVVAATFGWHRHTPPVLNLTLIALAAWVWVSLTRLSTARVALGGLVLVTFWPMVFWAPTAMQEAVHHAGAIALAGCFAHALGPRRRRAAMIGGWLLLGGLVFIRPSWAVVLPLWAIAVSHERPWPVRARAVALSLVMSGALLLAYSRTTAPFPSGFFFLKVLSLAEGGQAIWTNLRFNLERLAMPADYEPLENIMRVQYWGWLLGAAAIIVADLRRRRNAPHRPTAHTALAFVALAGATALTLVLYTLTNWAEHRVLSAFLLFGALLGAASPGRLAPALAAALVASNLVTTGPFLHAFEQERADNFIWDRRGVYELVDALDGRIVYEPGRPRWCNTLLAAQVPPHLIAVPPGIGLSIVREPDQLALPPRSQYVLLDAPALADFSRPLRLEPLATLPYGTLYRNLESGCRPHATGSTLPR